MYCSKCGTKLYQDSNYCTGCGNHVFHNDRIPDYYLKIGIIIGVSFVSAFVASTGIAMVVGFLIYNVLTDRLRFWQEILSQKFLLAAIFGWPLGLGSGIIGGLAGWFVGWLTASDVSNTNRFIVIGSVIGGLLGGLFSGFFIGINTIT